MVLNEDALLAVLAPVSVDVTERGRPSADLHLGEARACSILEGGAAVVAMLRSWTAHGRRPRWY
jgi:hypothetical protein